MMLTVRPLTGGPVIGYVERYTEKERGAGRWTRLTVERVYWRAIPFDTTREITYHTRKRDAVGAVRKRGSASNE